MYQIKYLLLKVIYCPKCKEDVLHECGYLYHKKDENSPLVRLLGVHECIKCGNVCDSSWHPVEVDWTLM